MIRAITPYLAAHILNRPFKLYHYLYLLGLFFGSYTHKKTQTEPNGRENDTETSIKCLYKGGKSHLATIIIGVGLCVENWNVKKASTLEKNKAFVSILNWNTYPFCGFLILIVLVLYVNQSITSVIWYIFCVEVLFLRPPKISFNVFFVSAEKKTEKIGSNKVSSQFFFLCSFFFSSLSTRQFHWKMVN